ncbi:MAG TPA: 3-deoxy-7-phosphoheptulonate synthase [Vicinamibacterales bacterium]|nr:3-deoxy-7-phosphoheptulonate synthase [Vicinamibacterales bacterium]
MIAVEQHPAGVSPPVHLDDARIRTVQEITVPAQLLHDVPVPRSVAEFVHGARGAISRILAGADPRLLVVVGPCSIHDVAATLEYARWIRRVSREVGDALVIVMRVYLEKPRTRTGWKGLINDPRLDGTFHIDEGLALARRLLLQVNTLGVPTATEFVDPITPQYIGDLISWAAIGARTTESQVHRELASGLSCPVGFKNSTTGDVSVAVNAVIAARRAHHFLGVTKSGRAAIVSTTGNTDCHIILRGGPRPNYDGASVKAAVGQLMTEGVCPRVMVDCSHGNSAGDYRRQLLVASEIARRRRDGCEHVCGVMVESNLIAGRQPFVSGGRPVPGLSITDPCLGIEDTGALLKELAAAGRPVDDRSAVSIHGYAHTHGEAPL